MRRVPLPPSQLDAPPRRRGAQQARRLLRRYRRWLGAALLGGSVLLVVPVLAPPTAPVQLVAVATRDLPTGAVLTSDDVTVEPLPRHAAWSAALGEDEAVGAVLAGPLAAGEPITATRLLGEALLVGTSADTVALPVRVADADAATLVAAGDLIDLLVVVPGEATSTVRTVGRALPVLVPARTAHSSSAPGLAAEITVGQPGATNGLIVVAASPAQVRAIVAGGAAGPLSLVIVRSAGLTGPAAG